MRIPDLNDLVPRTAALRRVAAAVLFAGLLLRPVPSFGQPAHSPDGLRGFALGGLFPSGAFDSHVGRDGAVGALYLALRSGLSPIFAGFELSGSYYGHVHRHAHMDNIPEVQLDVHTYNNIIQGLFFLRLQPSVGDVSPYVEGLAGISYIFTDTTVSDGDAQDDFAYDINFDDWTVAAGAGAGVVVRLRGRPGGGGGGTFLDFKVRYMAGGRASYLSQGGLVVDGDRVSYNVDRSATNFFTVQAGLTWFF